MNRTTSPGNSGGLHVDSPASIFQAADYNRLQEELIGVIAGGGLTPDEADLGQVLKAIKALINAGAPVGSVIAWLTEVAPLGYLECDGAAVSRTTYAELFAKIGVTFGPGNGTTTFNLPDLRGEFLRGWDHGSAHDPNAATRTNRGDGTTGDHVGTKQADELEGHNHASAWAGNDGRYGAAPDGAAAYVDRTTSGGTATTASLSGSTGGAETRPRNVAVMYVIRY